MAGQGYAFGGAKARLIRQRLREIERDPAAAKKYFGGSREEREDAKGAKRG